MNCRGVVPLLGFLFGDIAEGGREKAKRLMVRSPSTQAIARIMGAAEGCFRTPLKATNFSGVVLGFSGDIATLLLAVMFNVARKLDANRPPV